MTERRRKYPIWHVSYRSETSRRVYSHLVHVMANVLKAV